MVDVQIPRAAVSDGKDLRAPTRALLEDLNLLGSAEDTASASKLGAVLTGPPESVALIEAGATAAAKWWASGLGGAVIAAWAAIATWWGDQEPSIQSTTIWAASIATAAAVIAIGYLIASDVRGRAAASVATIQARAHLAQRMIQAAESTYEPASATSDAQFIPLPAGIVVRNHDASGTDEDGWRAVALERGAGGTIAYVIVKGSAEAKLPASRLSFE